MRTKLTLAGLLLTSQVVAGNFQTVVSPFKACSDVRLIKYEDYQKNQAEVMGLIGKTNVQVMPPTGFTKTQIQAAPKLSKSDVARDLSPHALLTDIGGVAAKYLDSSILKMEKMVSCYLQQKGSAAWKPKLNLDGRLDEFNRAMAIQARTKPPEQGENGCIKLRSLLKQAVVLNQREARVHLALSVKAPSVALPASAYSVNNYGPTKYTREQARSNPSNPKVSPTSLYSVKLSGGRFPQMLIPKDMPDLSAAEKARVHAIAAKFASTYEPALDKWESKTWDGPLPRLESFSINHRLNYYEVLQRVPVLGYLGTNRLDGVAGDEAIFWASMQVLKNAYKERGRIKQAFAKSQNNLVPWYKDAKSESAWRLMDFLIYQNTIEDLLKARPRRCAIATALSFYNDDGKARFAVVTGGALVVATVATAIIAPPVAPAIAGSGASLLGTAEVAALILGPPVGFAFTAKSYFDYSRVKQATLNNVVNASGQKTLAKPSQVIAAQKELTFAVAMLPLSFVGTGVISKTLAYSAVKSGLQNAGLSSQKMATLMANARSTNPQIANAARREIQDAVGKYAQKLYGRIPSATEEKLAQTMLDKGFLGNPQKPQVGLLERMAQKLAKLNPARRDEVAKKAEEIIKRLDPSKVAGAKQSQVMDLVESAAAFGADDIDSLVKNINEWPEGLDGLTSVYKSAAEKMAADPDLITNPAFKNATPEGKRAMAMQKALDDRLAAKGLTETERKLRVASMCQCSKICMLR